MQSVTANFGSSARIVALTMLLAAGLSACASEIPVTGSRDSTSTEPSTAPTANGHAPMPSKASEPTGAKADGHATAPGATVGGRPPGLQLEADSAELSEIIAGGAPKHRPRPLPSLAFLAAPAVAVPASDDSDTLQQLINRAVTSLRSAEAAFNTPSEIPLGVPQHVSLVMSFDIPVEILKERIASQGPTSTAEVSAAPEMEAVLVGSSGLTVRPLQAGPKQAVPSHGTTQWDWEVEGVVSGPQLLTLSVSAILSAPGSPEYSIRTYSRTLNVTVSNFARVSQFITNNWQWLWAVVVVPLAGLLWPKVRKRFRTQIVGRRAR